MYKKSFFLSIMQLFIYGNICILYFLFFYNNKLYNLTNFISIISALICCFIFNKKKFSFKIKLSELKSKKSIVNLIYGVCPVIIFIVVGIIMEKNRHLFFSTNLLFKKTNLMYSLLTNAFFYIQVSLFPFSYSLIKYLFVSRT